MSYIIPGSQYTPTVTTTKSPIDPNLQIKTLWVMNFSLSPFDVNNLTNDIINFSNQYHLTVAQDINYHLKIYGSVSNFNNALGVNIQQYTDQDDSFYASETPVQIPIRWKDQIIYIFGTNSNRIVRKRKPIIRPLVTSRGISPIAGTDPSYYPTDLAATGIYDYPTGDGTGQTVGVIALGGGYYPNDINNYLAAQSLPNPTLTNILIDGASGVPSATPTPDDIEIALDIEVVASLVPNASIRVYIAPGTDTGQYDALNQAIADNCNVITCSFGNTESVFTGTTAYNQLLATAVQKNITTTAASGDNGSTDSGDATLNVDFPASSPNTLACGGTTISVTGGTLTDEETWNNYPVVANASGGGFSSLFAKPSYQNGITYTGLTTHRGVPDVCADADPNTGYNIIYGNGTSGIIGGTSATAPMWAGLVARLNQNLSRSLGFINPKLYNNPSVLRDITAGNNNVIGGTLYGATGGWDAATGLGSPKGQAILSYFQTLPVASFTGTPLSGGIPLSVQFTDTSTFPVGSPITSWLWNFGDGNTSTSQSPQHTYSLTGTYTVSLTVNNANGPDMTTKINYITANNLPTASFTAVPTSGVVPLVVQFTDTSTNGGFPITGWLWNFGDSTTSTSQSPQHTYTNPGSYTVSLTVTNSQGNNMITKPNDITGNSSSNICFRDNTKILCFENGKEVYIPIQNITKGTLVKTLRNGFLPVHTIAHSIVNNPNHSDRIVERLYECKTTAYPDLFENLYLTGAHSILVDKITEEERLMINKLFKRVFITDKKYRLMVCVDKRAKPYDIPGSYRIWHLALESDNDLVNYGIYANGLLVESVCIKTLNNKPNLTKL